MKKLLLIATAALLSIPPAFAQRIVVRVAPPPVIVEHPGPRPHGGWVWVHGYHRWDGARYVWVSGHWVEPIHPHAVWIDGHWRHDRDGYVWVDGHWR